MNTKYLLAVSAIVTSLTLGACGNSNSNNEHAHDKDKQQEESKVKTDNSKNYLVHLNLKMAKRSKVQQKLKMAN